MVLANRAALRRTLKSFADSNTNDLQELIREIAQANRADGGDVPGLTGLGGVLGHAFLDLAQESLDQNGMFDAGRRVVVSLSGQIQDYAFDRDTGSGRLEVVTFFTRQVVPASGALTPARTDAYRWTIRVEAGGFEVIERDDALPDGPFPGTLAFSDATKARVASLGFTRKLWAKGEAIVIEAIALDRNHDPDDPRFVELDRTKPKFARLFQTNAATCIDMMFVGEPPATMADLRAPPFYCLGRCEQPLIVNTR